MFLEKSSTVSQKPCSPVKLVCRKPWQWKCSPKVRRAQLARQGLVLCVPRWSVSFFGVAGGGMAGQGLRNLPKKPTLSSKDHQLCTREILSMKRSLGSMSLENLSFICKMGIKCGMSWQLWAPIVWGWLCTDKGLRVQLRLCLAHGEGVGGLWFGGVSGFSVWQVLLPSSATCGGGRGEAVPDMLWCA